MPAMMPRRPPSLAFWTLLVVVLAVALALRSYGVGWGLPDYHVPDEVVFTAETAERIASREPVPEDFFYPHLHIQTVATLQSLISDPDDRVAGVRLGRQLNVLFSAATVLVTLGIGWWLFDPRVGLAAAALLAVAPYPVASAHINGSDGPLVFWMASSFLLTTVGFRSGRVGWLVAAGGVAGLAAAVKYPGAAAVLPPLWASLWVARGDGGPSRRPPAQVLALAAGVGIASLVGFFAGCPRCVSNWDVCLEGVQMMNRANYEQSASTSLRPEGWLSYRYGFQIVASLPFCLGALSCAISYLGLGSMARRARHEALLVGSLVLPFFAVIGGSAAIYPRYCLPLLPFLCLGAGFVTVRALSAPGAWGAVGSIAASLALLHSLLVSIALASGFNENARLAAIADLTARARAWSAERPRSTTPRVGIFPFMRIYDGLGARLKESPDLRLSGFEADADWLERGGPDFLVFSEPFLLRSLRVDALNGDSFWADLTDEKLGYERVAKIEPGFAGKGIYAALDPLFVHAWTNGDIGFSIFERVAPRARGSSGRRP